MSAPKNQTMKSLIEKAGSSARKCKLQARIPRTYVNLRILSNKFYVITLQTAQNSGYLTRNIAAINAAIKTAYQIRIAKIYSGI